MATTASASTKRMDAGLAPYPSATHPTASRKRRTVRAKTKTEARDKLRNLREDIAASVQAPAAYTVRQAVEDWLESGLDGRSENTITKYRYVLAPVVERLGPSRFA